MFGFSKYAAERVTLSLHPGDLELGERTGRHAVLDFEDDILGALVRGTATGVQSTDFAEIVGSTSAPDFAGAVYRRYSGAGGSTVLARIIGDPSGYAGVALCSIEIAYRKGDASGAAAARAITASVEKALRALNTLGSISCTSQISPAMKSEAKAALR